MSSSARVADEIVELLPRFSDRSFRYKWKIVDQDVECAEFSRSLFDQRGNASGVPEFVQSAR